MNNLFIKPQVNVLKPKDIGENNLYTTLPPIICMVNLNSTLYSVLNNKNYLK